MNEIEILKEANKYGFRLAITSIIVIFLISIGIILGTYKIIKNNEQNITIDMNQKDNINSKQEVNNAKTNN